MSRRSRGVADVAAEGALVADLQRSEAVQQVAEIGVFLVERAVAVGERGGCTDFQVGGSLFDALELGDVAT